MSKKKKYSMMFEEVIDKSWSKKIIDKLYQHNLSAVQFENVLWRIKEYFMKNQYWKLVKTLDDKVIDEIIGDIQQGMERELAMETKYNEQEKTIWMFNDLVGEFKEVKEGDKVEIQIMRTGKWNHALYGKVEVSEATLDDVEKNYKEDTRGIDLAIDENHEPNHKALGWIKGLTRKTKDSLFATIELTKMGADLISQGAYKYFSPEIIFNKRDEETGKIIKNLLIGGAFTNRPFFKAMKPLMANEDSLNDEDDNKNILFFNTNDGMKTILDLLGKFTEGGLTAEDKQLLRQKFSELSEDDKTEDLTNAVNEALEDKKEEVKDIPKVEVKTEDKPSEQFNHEGEITIKMSELDILKRDAAEAVQLRKERKENEVKEKVNQFCFSEQNEDGIITPNVKSKTTEFVLSLDETQEKQFFEILEGVKKVSLGEIGSDKEGGEFSENSDEFKFFKEQLGMSDEEAMEAMKLAKSKK